MRAPQVPSVVPGLALCASRTPARSERADLGTDQPRSRLLRASTLLFELGEQLLFELALADTEVVVTRIRTVLYGDQRLSRSELEILHTAAMQRLYGLKQLAYQTRSSSTRPMPAFIMLSSFTAGRQVGRCHRKTISSGVREPALER